MLLGLGGVVKAMWVVLIICPVNRLEVSIDPRKSTYDEFCYGGRMQDNGGIMDCVFASENTSK
jgi:hypothetical protein